MTEKREQIFHICDVDLPGNLPIERALRKIPGIGFMTSRAICLISGIDRNKTLSELSEEELKRLEEIIKNPPLPSWMKNRRRDPRTGEDIHLTGINVKLKMKEDISFLKKIKCWRGIRHELGLKVRGQRLHSSWRRSGASVGVQKRKAKR
jgi:small subunit ribosomal protein S13